MLNWSEGSVWDGFDYEGHPVQTTKSSSLPPPKTCANQPRSFLHRSKHEKLDQKGARAQFKD
jgi:hypothetical protein